jgi:branched-chain amino acid transport system substrate-binding protein
MNILFSVLDKTGPDRDKILAALPSVDYKGVLGETRFDEKGDTSNHTITLFQVTNGKFEPVK